MEVADGAGKEVFRGGGITRDLAKRFSRLSPGCLGGAMMRPLTLRQLQVLAGLSHEPKSFAELGGWLQCHRVTALQSARRLALDGLVDLDSLKLTAKGKRTLDAAHSTLAASLKSVRP